MNAHVSVALAAKALRDTSDVASPRPQLAALLDRQKAAFASNDAPTLAERKADLLKLKNAIRDHLSELVSAVDADFEGRSRKETALIEGVPVIQSIKYLSANLKSWMRPQTRRVELEFRPASARVVYQPLGVVGIISPWNYPIGLSMVPLATAIAAGNRAMLKLSELTPATSALLAKMLGEIFPQEQVAVVSGGPEVGAAFATLPFDHLLFTGSTAVGKTVMQAASVNLVPVTLELGGKSPAIVDKGISLERAAASIAFGKLANAGQSCVAPDFALVEASEVDAFVAAYDGAVRTFYPEGAASSDFTSIVNGQHYRRLRAMLDDARAKGARVFEVGNNPRGAAQRPHTLAPTIVLDATPDMRIMKEEIFGPILPVVAYREIDAAIAYVNAMPRPLALYFFGEDGETRRKVLSRTISGNVTINDTLLHYVQDDLPFGGVGASGMGAYHGVEGFRALSHARGIFEQSRWSMTSLLRPPFGELARLATWYFTR
jgi:coniferyl-aldehyde dehydrogenase